MGEQDRRVQALRKMTGDPIKALTADLEISAATDAPDEETSGLNLGAHSFAATLNFQDRAVLRAVVKKVHLRNIPGDMITDLEADKVIDAMGPITQEKLIAKAVAHGMRG
jgi:hypothetical protein